MNKLITISILLLIGCSPASPDESVITIGRPEKATTYPIPIGIWKIAAAFLVQIRRKNYAFSPALGSSFRIAAQDEETITQLALEGKCYLHSNLFGLKAAIDKLLNKVLKKAENLAYVGKDAEATKLLKSCVSLSGAKDDCTLNLVDLLINSKKQRISTKDVSGVAIK